MSLKADYREQADRMRDDAPGPASHPLFAHAGQPCLPGFGRVQQPTLRQAELFVAALGETFAAILGGMAETGEQQPDLDDEVNAELLGLTWPGEPMDGDAYAGDDSDDMWDDPAGEVIEQLRAGYAWQCEPEPEPSDAEIEEVNAELQADAAEVEP